MERPFEPGEGFSGQIPFENPEKWRRRRLPHYNAAGIYQMITYRLADSLPHDVVVRLKQRYGEDYEDLLKPQDYERNSSTARSAAVPGAANTARSAAVPAGQNSSTARRAKALRKSLEEVMDSGYGSCLLRRPDFAERVIEAWRFHEGVRYRIIAFVVMPNHVHILIEVLSGMEPGSNCLVMEKLGVESCASPWIAVELEKVSVATGILGSFHSRRTAFSRRDCLHRAESGRCWTLRPPRRLAVDGRRREIKISLADGEKQLSRKSYGFLAFRSL